jgi:hypothetical protein
MFAKKARSLNFSRGFGLRRNGAAVRPCNDNQSIRRAAPSRPMRRPTLFCHWHETSAGRLECRWHSETRVPSGSEEPGISWRSESLCPLKVLTIRPPRDDRRGRKATLCHQSNRSALTDSVRPFSIHGIQVRRFVLIGQKGIRCDSRSGSSPELPPQLSAASRFPNVPLGFAEQSLGRRTTVRTREPGDLPEQRHPSAARGARVGRASAVVTERIVTR